MIFLAVTASLTFFDIASDPDAIEKNKQDTKEFSLALDKAGKSCLGCVLRGEGFPSGYNEHERLKEIALKAKQKACNKYIFTSETMGKFETLKIAEYLSWLSGKQDITYNFISGANKSIFSVSELDANRYGSNYVQYLNSPTIYAKREAKKLLKEHLETTNYKDAKNWHDRLYNTAIKYGQDPEVTSKFTPEQNYDAYGICNAVDSFFGFYGKPSISDNALSVAITSTLQRTVKTYEKNNQR
ncbi:hypothetical protein [Aeromonas bivalvium]|uniref:hypothetical protein n=1 Tax=Aeromonas bivalvium TaxID=440079 RepID=UPI0038D01CC9